MVSLIDQTISHYKILEKLGEGGMGVVYKAQDTNLNRTVALKFLPPHLSASEKDKARFIQEAQALSALNHPNVCTIHDIQEYAATESPGTPAEKQLFIVMEFVEGRTLRELVHALNGSLLPIRRALDIGIQIADGLAAAHEKGIVHRDVKPENIMVRRDGLVQIMDFGVAKLRTSGAPRLTEEGSTVGTAGYMSPEQLQGQDVDHRSDIFSLGVLLFELLTCQLPFKGVHHAALAYEIVNVDTPPVSSVRPEISHDLDRIVAECIQKDPADRFQSSAEVAKELRRARRALEQSRKSPPASHRKAGSTPEPSPDGSEASSVQPGTLSGRNEAEPDQWDSAAHQAGRSLQQPGRSMHQPGTSTARYPAQASARQLSWLAPAAAAFGLIALVLFLWKPWGTGDSHPQPVARFSLMLPQGSSLELSRDGLALSPDGKYLAVVVRHDSSSRLFMRDIDQFEMRPVAATAGLNVSGPFFSPDGQWLGFFANGKMMKVSLRGGTPVTICDGAPMFGQASWGEGGNIVFIKEFGSYLWIVSSEAGSTPRPLTKLNPEAGEHAHLFPRVLPGGKEAIFSIWCGSAFSNNFVAAVDLSTGEHHTIVTGATAASYVRTGYLIYTLGSTLMAVPFDAKQLKVTGEPLPVLEKVLMDGSDVFSYHAVSDNGTLAYAPGEVEFSPTAISLVEHGSTVKRIETGKANVGFPAFSPDGKQLAVVITGESFQLGVFDLQRDVLTPLTFKGDNIRQIWSPDGTRIAFSSNIEGDYQVFTVPANGSAAPQKLFTQEGNPHPCSWSSDGKTLAYVAVNKETGNDIWLYSAVSTPPTRPLLATKANEYEPQFSPDGHWLAYASDESGENEVYVQPFPSMAGRWRVSNGGGNFPRWSPDGRRILFQRNDEITAVPITAANDGSIAIGREERFLVRSGLISFNLAPNGKTVVIGQAKAETLVDRVNVVLNWSEDLKAKFASPETQRAR